MVQKIVRGMRQHGKTLIGVLAAVLVVGIVFFLTTKPARANYTTSIISTLETAPCGCTGGCSSPCSGPWVFPEGVTAEGYFRYSMAFDTEVQVKGVLTI